MRPVNNGAEPVSIPLLDACGSYIHLLENLRPKPYSGLRRLYLNMSAGLFAAGAGDLERWSSESLIKGVGEGFAQVAIKFNIENWIDVLGVVIRQRLKVIETLPPHEESSWVSLSRTRRSFYNPSPRVAKTLQTLQGFGQLAPVAQKNTIGPAAIEVMTEVNQVIGNAGTFSPNPRCDDIILSFLDAKSGILGHSYAAAIDYQQIHLPLLKIYLGLARLLLGAVSIGSSRARTTTLSEKILSIRISDTTLAALPVPNWQTLEFYAEPEEAGPLSMKGHQYIANLTTYYTTDIGGR